MNPTPLQLPADPEAEAAAGLPGFPALDYAPVPGSFDGLATDAGGARPHWLPFFRALSGMGLPALIRRWNEAQHVIREHGITYNVYADPKGADRPWEVDPLPLLLSAGEWQTIEAGIAQRADLLNRVLADLYGPQQLMRSGAIPASVA